MTPLRHAFRLVRRGPDRSDESGQLGPRARHVVKTGKTPALSAEQARELVDSIPGDSIAGTRDRALIAVMCFSFARVGAVVGMNIEDYFQDGKRWWIRLHEKRRETARGASAS